MHRSTATPSNLGTSDDTDHDKSYTGYILTSSRTRTIDERSRWTRAVQMKAGTRLRSLCIPSGSPPCDVKSTINASAKTCVTSFSGS